MSAPQTLATPRRAAVRAVWRGAVLPLAVLALWWAAAHWHWSDSALMVSPLDVLRSAREASASGWLWQAIGASLARMAAGFSIGAAAGVGVGFALGLSRRAERAVAPTLHAVKQVSLLAWIPLISVWFGLGDAAKVAFLSLAAFLPVLLNTMEGVRGVPRALVEAGRVFAFTRWQIVTRVVLPAATPSIFTGLYLGLVYAWLATLGAEFLLSAGQGIGNLLLDGREHFRMDQVLLGIVVVALVGFALNGLAGRIERRLLAGRQATR